MRGRAVGQKHRIHSEEFKADAIRRATEPGAVIAHVAEELDLNPGMLTKWVRISQGKTLPSDYVKKGLGRTYTPEFKAEAVRRASEPGAVIAHVAEEMDVTAFSVSNWLRQAQEKASGNEQKKGTAVGRPLPAPKPDTRDEEIARLREQVAHLEEENAALRGVAGHYITKRK